MVSSSKTLRYNAIVHYLFNIIDRYSKLSDACIYFIMIFFFIFTYMFYFYKNISIFDFNLFSGRKEDLVDIFRRSKL